ncbi:hypothetical protein FA09DRAFT_327446 [Tilletiopsis washingtonensis]|uniref:Thioredoxin domain-containing protein n=1 Tax=Tilletiopsis washingtonensis TaxID=58919 RepID=A0A316ZHH2_9BASI|nr:hypothetical protein FA09DRAFT_327446 [Tilletiopsis washingtonensis]PWO00717.1 hypothetical protein FA09DRAFT_327446 [Tilletiopsis washingtonensis]
MAARTPANPHYLIFFSSGAPPWCPDCVAALPAIHAVFGKDSGAAGAEAELLTVGREEWKNKQNPHAWRSEYNVQGVPTIIKWQDGKEVGRLDEDGCKDEKRLREFTA